MLVPAVYNTSAGDDAETIDASELASNNTENDAEADEPNTTHRIIHKVKKGETLTALADRYDTSSQTLMKLNGLRSTKVKVGQSLTISNGAFKTANFKTTKVSANRKSIKSRNTGTKHKSSKRISARSHIRLR